MVGLLLGVATAEHLTLNKFSLAGQALDLPDGMLGEFKRLISALSRKISYE